MGASVIDGGAGAWSANCCAGKVFPLPSKEAAQSENEGKMGGLLRPGRAGALNQLGCSRMAFPLSAPVTAANLLFLGQLTAQLTWICP